MTEAENRRPISSRDWRIIQGIARWLNAQNVTPNQISVASAVFAAVAGIFLSQMPSADTLAELWFVAIGSVFFVMMRALCNLWDGLVAVEGGKGTKSGELFNDFPDRLSDAFIFIGAGYACASISYGLELGWLAALLSIMTAYTRYLGRSLTGISDFGGPMAKATRMGVISLAVLLTPVEAMFDSYGVSLMIGLCVINVGCVLTVRNRLSRAYKTAEGK